MGLIVGILCVVVQGGLLLGSSCTVRRVVGEYKFVISDYDSSYYDIGRVFLEWVVLRSCKNHF